MANTHILIGKTVLSSPSNTISLTGISTSYSALRMIGMLRSDSATNTDTIKITRNGSGSGYYDIWMGSNNGAQIDGSDDGSAGTSSNASICPAANAPSDCFGLLDFHVPYNKTGAFDNGHIFYYNTAVPYASSQNQVRSTAFIHFATGQTTSISLAPTTGTNFVTGSSLWLYGILNT